MLIEQALLTTMAHRQDGAKVRVHSPGVTPDDLAELVTSLATGDGLLEKDSDATSVNFFPLPSGAYCVAQTARQGAATRSQALVVRPADLARFHNQPFALLNAAFVQGALRTHDDAALELEPLRLAGRAPMVDASLLAGLLTDWGLPWLHALVEAALTRSHVALMLAPLRARLVAGLLHCLPTDMRPRFSFSTGLAAPPGRVPRLSCVANMTPEVWRKLRGENFALLSLAGKPPSELTPASGWSGFVACAISSGHTGFLAEQLARAPVGLLPGELNAWGDQLIEELAAVAARGDSGREPAPDPLRRADAPHAAIRSAVASDPVPAATLFQELDNDPAVVVGRECPQAVETLETLDDLVFEAIAGKAGALDRVRQLWPQAQNQVGPELLEESRAQYLRHALHVWQSCVEQSDVRNPALAVAAMDVICLLFDHPG